MEHFSVDSLMVWMVNYLMNSAWQVPLVLLVAMAAARLVGRLYSAAAVHWTWVSALVLATVLPAIRVDVWPSFPWGSAAAVAGGHVQVTMMASTAVAGGSLRLSFAMMAVLLAVYGAVILYFAGRIVWGVWKTRSLRGERVGGAVAGGIAVALGGFVQATWSNAGGAVRIGRRSGAGDGGNGDGAAAEGIRWQGRGQRSGGGVGA